MKQKPQRYKLAIMALAFLVIPLVSMYFHGRSDRDQSPFESLLLTLTGPGQAVMDGVMGGVVEGWQRYVYLVEVETQNQEMRDQIENLRMLASRALGLEEENRRLRSLIDFKRERNELKLLAAQVIARDLSPLFNVARVRVDRGQSDGVRPNMPVVTSQGLVGRLETVATGYADVMMLTDSRSRIDVQVSGKSVSGTVIGTGDGPPVLRFPRSKTHLNSGDVIITTGHDKMFPRGLTVGYVSSSEAKQVGQQMEIPIEPAVRFSTLQEMFVILHSQEPETGLNPDDQGEEEGN